MFSAGAVWTRRWIHSMVLSSSGTRMTSDSQSFWTYITDPLNCLLFNFLNCLYPSFFGASFLALTSVITAKSTCLSWKISWTVATLPFTFSDLALAAYRTILFFLIILSSVLLFVSFLSLLSFLLVVSLFLSYLA